MRTTKEILLEPFGPFPETALRSRPKVLSLRQWNLRSHTELRVVGLDETEGLSPSNGRRRPDNSHSASPVQFYGIVTIKGSDWELPANPLTPIGAKYVEAEADHRGLSKRNFHSAVKTVGVEIKIILRGQKQDPVGFWTSEAVPDGLMMRSASRRTYRILSMSPLMFKKSQQYLSHWCFYAHVRRLISDDNNRARPRYTCTPQWIAARWHEVHKPSAEESGQRPMHYSHALLIMAKHASWLVNDQLKCNASKRLVDVPSWLVFSIEVERLKKRGVLKYLGPTATLTLSRATARKTISSHYGQGGRRRRLMRTRKPNRKPQKAQLEAIPPPPPVTKPRRAYDPDFSDPTSSAESMEGKDDLPSFAVPDSSDTGTATPYDTLPLSSLQPLSHHRRVWHCPAMNCAFMTKVRVADKVINQRTLRAIEEHRDLHLTDWGVKISHRNKDHHHTELAWVQDNSRLV